MNNNTFSNKTITKHTVFNFTALFTLATNDKTQWVGLVPFSGTLFERLFHKTNKL